MLRVGSDCSGMCTELHALDALGIPYEHVFCSETWEPAIRYTRANHRAKRMYRDVTERALEDAPVVDLYVCGFPCQPVSGMNQKKRVHDPRREPMWCAVEYIKAKRPKYWVLENVTGLMQTIASQAGVTLNNAQLFDRLMEEVGLSRVDFIKLDFGCGEAASCKLNHTGYPSAIDSLRRVGEGIAAVALHQMLL